MNVLENSDALTDLGKKEQQKRIKSCIDQLPKELGFIIMLYYYKDLSITDIAKIVGDNPNYVKQKLFRARKKLHSVLQKQLEPEELKEYVG